MDVLFVLEKSGAARFEDLNAIVRWTIARRVGPRRLLEIFFPLERKFASNLAGTLAVLEVV